jgi:hypothetical protein
MSKGNVKNNSNGNSNSFLISKNQTSRFSAKSRASLTRTLYVSLDNADKVIEGGPSFSRSVREGGAFKASRSSAIIMPTKNPPRACRGISSLLRAAHARDYATGKEPAAKIESRGAPPFKRPLCFVMRRNTFSRKAWADSIRDANPGFTEQSIGRHAESVSCCCKQKMSY